MTPNNLKESVAALTGLNQNESSLMNHSIHISVLTQICFPLGLCFALFPKTRASDQLFSLLQVDSLMLASVACLL